MSDATLVWHRWAHRSSASCGRHEPTIGDETKRSHDKNCNDYNAMNNRHSSGQLGNYVDSSTSSPASERPVVKLKRDGETNKTNKFVAAVLRRITVPPPDYQLDANDSSKSTQIEGHSTHQNCCKLQTVVSNS